MKRFFKKSAFILCGLLLSIIIIGQIVPGEESTVNTAVVTEKVLVPGGQSIGVKMDVKGVLIVGLEEIESSDGEKINPGLLSGLQIGDRILEIDGKEVENAEEVEDIVNEIQDTVKLKIKRSDEVMNISVEPVESADDGMYKLGVWVKDKTAGIGTLTYYDPSNSTFGALGHGIVDTETNSILSVESGVLLEAQVQEIQEGEDGQPGEIRGIFYNTNDPLGSLERNSEYGVFGTAYHAIESSVYDHAIAVGTRSQVELGKAYILTTVSDNKVGRYEIEIEEIENQDSPSDKSMVIRVTDEELLEESGGIVQGMSGSPIIQNDRIIGAVTHVFVNDPERGYGIFIEWMLEESDIVEN